MQEPIKYRMKLIDPICKPEKQEKGNWTDLRSRIDVTMEEGDECLIPLGIAVELPPGYEAHVIPRSSTYRRFGIILANSFGLIDNSYCGNSDEWCFHAVALRSGKIEKGDRICQYRIVEVEPETEIEFVEDLGNEDRGGLGSTGVK